MAEGQRARDGARDGDISALVEALHDYADVASVNTDIDDLADLAHAAREERDALREALAELRTALNEMGSHADAVTVAIKTGKPPAWGMLSEYSQRLDAAERKADALLAARAKDVSDGS